MLDSFIPINNEQKAYWLGFLYADGCNLPKYNRFILSLSSKDHKHVINFCNFMGVSPNKIKKKGKGFNYIGNRKIRNNGSSTITINSKKLSCELEQLGMVARKSLILKFPTSEIVPKKYMAPFIRGYFDGDGCLRKTYSDHAYRYNTIILGSKSFCSGLSLFLRNHLNINGCLWDSYKRKNCGAVSVSGNIQVGRFFDWLYSEATISLDRKHKIYLGLKNNNERRLKKKKLKSSRYNNITFDKSRNKWAASIRINKKTVRIGRYSSEEDAYKTQQKVLNGKSTRQNRTSISIA